VTAERVPYPVAARELLRNTLLDGARELLLARRWADITMADVAKAAGVSRQTLYNEFGSREEFAQAFVLRDGDRFLTAVEEAVDDHDDPAAALAAAFEVFLTAAAEDPLLRAVISSDGTDDLLRLVTTQGMPLLERTSERLTAVVVSRWPEVQAAGAALISECLVRLAISFAVLPASPAGMTGESIAGLLGPYVENLVGTRPEPDDR
jgi:AcrR family transcriptional regulator